MASDEVLEALDLCLACKACRTECPVGVDMARYKAEFLAQHHRLKGTPRESLFFGRVHDLARAGSVAPRLANLGNRLMGPLTKRLAGIDRRREMPKLAAEPFRKGFGKRAAGPRDGRPTVVLLDDTFHNFFQPGPLHATATVLERAGFHVELPGRQVCCGRAAWPPRPSISI